MDKYVITGATGLIGSALVKYLCKDNIIICPVRNIKKAKSIFNDNENGNIRFIECKIEKFFIEFEETVDYIIHCASPTNSSFFVENPVETLLSGILSTYHILEYAKKNEIRSFVFLSSIESYGIVLDENIGITEDYQGYVDPIKPRSSYNMSKRTCEAMCSYYALEYKVPCKVIRLAHVISTTIDDSDNRIIAQFVRAVINKEDITLFTSGASARQYIYIDDVVEGILIVLKRGTLGEVYNLANEDTYISAKDLADYVQKTFNPDCKVIISIDGSKGYPPDSRVKLDVSKIKKLGWKPFVGLEGMFSHLISNLKK